jgi:hypothetical protein
MKKGSSQPQCLPDTSKFKSRASTDKADRQVLICLERYGFIKQYYSLMHFHVIPTPKAPGEIWQWRRTIFKNFQKNE